MLCKILYNNVCIVSQFSEALLRYLRVFQKTDFRIWNLLNFFTVENKIKKNYINIFWKIPKFTIFVREAIYNFLLIEQIFLQFYTKRVVSSAILSSGLLMRVVTNKIVTSKGCDQQIKSTNYIFALNFRNGIGWEWTLRIYGESCN